MNDFKEVADEFMHAHDVITEAMDNQLAWNIENQRCLEDCILLAIEEIDKGNIAGARKILVAKDVTGLAKHLERK